MRIKTKGETGSALSLVLIFVTISGLAIASLIFVTQISTSGVHQLSQGNKESSAVAEATADILARFQKDPTLGTPVFPTAADNCGLGQGFTLDPSIGVSFVSCVPVAGGSDTAITTIGTSTTNGTVGVDFGTTFSGNINSNNTFNSTTTITVANGSTVKALYAQVNVPSTGGTIGEKSAVVSSTTPSGPAPAPCTLKSKECKTHIRYWTKTHATPHLPTWTCSTTSTTFTLSPGFYTADDVKALMRVTSPSDSSKYVGWLWKSGKYEDGTACTNKGQQIEFKFKDGEYIFTGGTEWKISNSKVILTNDPTNVVMCVTKYKDAGCANSKYSATGFAEEKETDQYSCARKSREQTYLGATNYASSDSDYHGVRMFFEGTNFNVLAGTVYLCGTDFSDAQVLDNPVFISADSERASICKSRESDWSSHCPSSPSKTSNMTFGNSSEVHLGGGGYMPASPVLISEKTNKQHTWDRAFISRSMSLTCTASSGCEHNVRYTGVGQVAKLTFKSKDGQYFSREFNLNIYDPTSVIKRKDN